MLNFREALRQRINDILVPAVGVGSSPDEYIKTFDDHLHDVDITGLPFLVISVRMKEKLLPGEIGTPYQKYTWTAHVYYLDMETNPNSYSIADQRMDHIMARVEKTLEEHKFLDINHTALRDIDDDGHQEVVYDSSIQAIMYDRSGQEDRQSFVSELYFEVYTDRS